MDHVNIDDKDYIESYDGNKGNDNNTLINITYKESKSIDDNINVETDVDMQHNRNDDIHNNINKNNMNINNNKAENNINIKNTIDNIKINTKTKNNTNINNIIDNININNKTENNININNTLVYKLFKKPIRKIFDPGGNVVFKLLSKLVPGISLIQIIKTFYIIYFEVKCGLYDEIIVLGGM